MRLTAPLIAIAFLFSACAVDVSDPPQGSDSEEVGADASPPADDDPVPEEDEPAAEDPEEETPEEPELPEDDCSLGDLGVVANLIEPQAGVVPLDSSDPDGDKFRFVWGKVDETVGLELDLWDGYGVFADGHAATGLYEIDGEKNAADCGLCLLAATDMDKEEDQWRVFLADSGTVNLISISETVAAVATNVTFRELDRQTGEPIEDGCTGTVTSVTLSAEISP